MDEVTEFDAQVAEATADDGTRTVRWRDRDWHVRSKPGAKFVYAFEQGHPISAVKAVMQPAEFEALMDLDPDLDGPAGIDGFVTACNSAWGMTKGN